MTIATMPKKQVPARIDTEVLEALRLASDAAGMSIAKYLEDLLVNNLKTSGRLPMDFLPSKAQWGGIRNKKTEPSE